MRSHALRRGSKACRRFVVPGACVLLLAGTLPVAAQEPVQTRFAPLPLLLPASTRAMGLGDAFLMTSNEPAAIFYNPGLLTASRGLGAEIQSYDHRGVLGSIAAAVEWWGAVVGVGAQALTHRTAETGSVADPGELGTGGPRLATALVGGIGYARTLLGFRMGLALKVAEQRHSDERAATGAADVGAVRAFGPATVGLTVQNLGGDLRLNEATLESPARAVLGASYRRFQLGPLDLQPSAYGAVRRDGRLTGGLGTEWSYYPVVGRTFFARAGVRRADAGMARPFTLGGGFSGDRFAIDYAFESLRGPRGAAHRVALRWW